LRPAPVRRIPIENVEPNPHNPRRLFDDEPMRFLQESIQKLGILVPITVYPKKRSSDTEPDRDKYVLLDGERRWRCARELKLPKIPAIIVARPTDVDNILTMFHIHNARAGWQLMPTALKLQTLMKELDETNERKLYELTKLSIGQIRRCKILLTYPTKFQNMMLAPPSERMKADFFIELQRIRGPALEEDFPPWRKKGDSACVDALLSKYLRGTIKAVTEFRRLAEIYRGCERKGKLKRFFKELNRLLEQPAMGIADVEITGVTYEKEFKEITRSGRRLLNQLNIIEPEVLAADESVLKILRRIKKLIESKLEQALLTEPKDGA
jgi:ParB family transcriptional regulator, chromosome partitioning protein